VQRIEGGILLPSGPGDAPMKCDCCSPHARTMLRAMNGPDSFVLYCPSSKKGYLMLRGVLRPMPGFYSGDDGLKIRTSHAVNGLRAA